MILHLKRNRLLKDRTLGTLYIDGAQTCYTLEDTLRDLKADGSGKIKGKTAIPPGHFKVVLDHSNRFGRTMPHILDVPFFTGIRIHSGNTPEDTEGCPIVGMSLLGDARDRIGMSRMAYELVMQKLNEAVQRQEDVVIDVTNP